MAVLKAKEIAKMGKNEANEKLKELKIELIKSRISASKAGKAKIREIKRTIARLLTLKNKIRKEQMTKNQIKPAEDKKQNK